MVHQEGDARGLVWHDMSWRIIKCCAQVSDQAVRLWQEGWFTNSTEFSGVSQLRNPKVRPVSPPRFPPGASTPL